MSAGPYERAEQLEAERDELRAHLANAAQQFEEYAEAIQAADDAADAAEARLAEAQGWAAWFAAERDYGIMRLLHMETNAEARLAELERERIDFTSKLGFGNNITEPAADLADMIDPIRSAFAEANEHSECPDWCELCGEKLADTSCEHCHGSGDASSLQGYAECQWCAGAGKIHPGCAEKSYADLRDELEATSAAVKLAQTGWADARAWAAWFAAERDWHRRPGE